MANVRAIYFRQTERAFEREVIALAELFGWRVFKDRATNARRACQGCGAPTPIARNTAGMVDLILIRRPRVIWAELKSERGKPSAAQIALLDELGGCGQEVYVWTPSTFRQIEAILR